VPPVSVALRWDAAVLCGGASRRFGSDKAAALVDGIPLAVRVGRVARDAGAGGVVGVGPRPALVPVLESAGMGVLADRWPGDGPAAAAVTALAAATAPVVAVLACDHPSLGVDTLVRLVDHLAAEPDCPAVVASAGGRLHPTVGVWRVTPCASLGGDYLVGGGRSLVGLVEAVGAAALPVDDIEVDDVDTPGDLARLADRRPGPDGHGV